MDVLLTLLRFALVIVVFILFMGFVVCTVMAIMARRQITRNAKETKDRIAACLPGSDCGQCRYGSCAKYADAAVQGTLDFVPCTQVSDDMNSRISLMWAKPKSEEQS